MHERNQHQFSLRSMLALMLICAVVFLSWRVAPSVWVCLNTAIVAVFAFSAVQALRSKPGVEYSARKRKIAWWMCLCAGLPMTILVLISIANGVMFYGFQRNTALGPIPLLLVLLGASLLGFFVCLAVSFQTYPLRRSDVAMGAFQFVTLVTSAAFPIEAAVSFVRS